MKKLLATMALVGAMSLSAICSAAGEGTILNKEQKAAEAFTAALTTEEGTLSMAASGFNADLKQKLNQEEFGKLKSAIKTNFGSLKETRFVSFTRYKDGDKVVYVGFFTKKPEVGITYLFDTTGKLFNFLLAPIEPPKPAPAPAKAPAPAPKK